MVVLIGVGVLFSVGRRSVGQARGCLIGQFSQLFDWMINEWFELSLVR